MVKGYVIDTTPLDEPNPVKWKKHPKCLGETDYWGEFDCGYQTTLICEDCKYGAGRKDPEARCNQ